MKSLHLWIFSALCLETCLSYHVMFYHDIGAKSHLIQYSPMVEELLRQGHEVTSVFFNSLKIKHENYTEIIVPNAFESAYKGFTKVLMADGGMSVWNYKLWLFMYEAWTGAVKDIALTPVREKKIVELMKSEKKVHLFVTTFGSAVFLADHFDCPVAMFLPIGPANMVLEGSGNVINPSIQPHQLSGHIDLNTFYARFINHFALNGEALLWKWIFAQITHIQREELGPGTRSKSEIMRDRFSILIGCSHPITHGSWPYLPNIIEVGAMHVKDPKPLPNDLQTLMDSATEGVVFVSFGSALDPSLMSSEKISMFLETFRRLKMRVIWKWDSDIQNLPKNVKTVAWAPQQDLLGHKNLKVFVTHGGLGSLQEAIYHKAVIVGIPFSSEQRQNILRATTYGYAKMLEWENLSADELSKAIDDGMRDEKMRSSLDRVHSQYTDAQRRPVETAVWWIEYVCRHKGAKMLQSTIYVEDIPWYQYHHVDILLFLTVVILSIFSASILTCMFCCRLCCRKKIKTE